MTYNIACIGEPLAEIRQATTEFSVAFGGDTLNTAIYCARAARDHDVLVHYVSAVGHDALSQGALDLLENEGVDTRYVSRDPQRQIGIYTIQNDESGERSFHYWRDTSAARKMYSSPDAPHLKAIKDANLVYLSGITLAILPQNARDCLWTALTARRATGLKVAFDSNYRPKLWENAQVARNEMMRFWQITNIALPSDEDEMALFGEADRDAIMERIVAAGAQTGALKCGKDGPIQLPRSTHAPKYVAANTVIDTTGAGDSFNGAYLAAVACGKPDQTALSEAHDTACRVVGHIGAILPASPPVMPRRMGSVIRLKPEHLIEYRRLHANVWPGVLQRLRDSHITNYSIYLKKPEYLMFSYFEYVGTDFTADNEAIAADPITKDWWAVCGPMQDPFETRADSEWWADMEEVFHLD